MRKTHRFGVGLFACPWARDRVATDAETAHAEMPAGSAVIYLGSTIHGGGANSTANEWRRGFHLSYTLGSLARRLIGYGVHDAIADMGGYLGMLDMRDPAQMLDDGSL